MRSLSHLRLLALVASLTIFPTSLFADEFCDHLKAFEKAGFGASSDAPKTHWIEMHWIGDWLVNSSLECRHSTDGESNLFCGWLFKHTSFEFADHLPRQILSCHGYRFPDLTSWEQWKSEITLRDDSNNLIFLEIDQTTHAPPDKAIRLSVTDKYSKQPLPPLFKSLP